MAQHQDLDVLIGVGHPTQTGQLDKETDEAEEGTTRPRVDLAGSASWLLRVWNTSSKGPVNLASRSRMRKRDEGAPQVTARLRAAWVTHEYQLAALESSFRHP